MTEEERLAIAKERIEFVLKTYQVYIYYDEDDGYLICIKGKYKTIEFDNGVNNV